VNQAQPSAPVVAVVLAGGDRDDRVARSVGAVSKALVPLRDEPMGAYVAHALRHAAPVQAVVWVGASDARIARWTDARLPSGKRMVDSLALGLGAGLARLGDHPDGRLLVVTADIPWWTPAGVEAFVRDAPAADVVYPVVRETDARAQFPDQKRTYAHLADGRFTGGNAVLLTAAAVARLLPLVDAAFAARKRPLQLAQLIGWGTLWGVATRQARIPDLEARISALLGGSARAHVTRDAAIAADIDDPSHLPAMLNLPRLADAGGTHATP
jgi:CTP:molybdopterin cytidylyltransferase MocA